MWFWPFIQELDIFRLRDFRDGPETLYMPATSYDLAITICWWSYVITHLPEIACTIPCRNFGWRTNVVCFSVYRCSDFMYFNASSCFLYPFQFPLVSSRRGGRCYAWLRCHFCMMLIGILCVYASRRMYIRASSGRILKTARHEEGCV